ncbi:hypothetical protein UCDDS831_g08991 [Diplodia seriata]|uniref:Uncharacterized protein n=1 Tax=Diplodia seriata TaxID=420778 RepID=A0A0G2DRW8_9PEZI|nr:hypothetical protein UCDDS831_g08991 [Diplodia seriata]
MPSATSPSSTPRPPAPKSRFETVLTTHPTIAESLLASLPTRSLIDLFHTSRHLRHFLAEYPLAWRTLSFRAPQPALGVNNPDGDALDGPARNAKQYALDALLIQVVVPFGTRLTSLDLCNTAVSGVRLVSRVLEPRVHTLQHLSVRGCKNVSIKYHLVPFLEPYVHPGSPWAKTSELALRSLYTYRCRHHRRRPYLPSSLMRRDSDSEPTHQLIEICHQLDIWTDTMWCTTPGGRCFRRKDYYSGRAAPGTNEVWVPFDRLWRSGNRIGPPDSDNPPAHSDGRMWEDAESGHDGEPLGTSTGWPHRGEGKDLPAHLRRSHRIFVEDVKCDQCGDAILERPIPRKRKRTNRAFTSQAFGTMSNLGVMMSNNSNTQSSSQQNVAEEEEKKTSNRFCLCQDCYRTFRWKVACKTCKKPLCKEHDFRGLKALHATRCNGEAAALTSASSFGQLVIADLVATRGCLNVNPPCPCAYCSTHYHCPVCSTKPRVQTLCRRDAERQAARLKEQAETERRAREAEALVRADEMALAVGEFFRDFLDIGGFFAGQSEFLVDEAATSEFEGEGVRHIEVASPAPEPISVLPVAPLFSQTQSQYPHLFPEEGPRAESSAMGAASGDAMDGKALVEAILGPQDQEIAAAPTARASPGLADDAQAGSQQTLMTENSDEQQHATPGSNQTETHDAREAENTGDESSNNGNDNTSDAEAGAEDNDSSSHMSTTGASAEVSVEA